MTPYTCLIAKKKNAKTRQKKFKKFAISLIAKAHKASPCQKCRSYFRLFGFGILEKDCMNRLRFLLSICYLLLGYSLELRPYSLVLGTAGSI